MKLADQICEYYFDNLHLLDDDKRFHFASRIAAWTGSKKAYDLLRQSYDYVVQPNIGLGAAIHELFIRPQNGKRNAHELRQPFFAKYPSLYGAHLALFRVRHLASIYNIDARNELYQSIPLAELEELRDNLLNDPEALRILSTFAVNYCYLLERVIKNDPTSLPLELFLDIDKLYDTNKIEDLQLLIYFYTHCIIGESNFYTREIGANFLHLYQQMISKLEVIIANNYEKINLDNKLEFLVCARICKMVSTLSERIYQECNNSISPEGAFVIDVHNQNGQSDRNNFIKSEHRNVLFIMSTTPYNPHSTLVD
jgi:hypothetical protein